MTYFSVHLRIALGALLLLASPPAMATNITPQSVATVSAKYPVCGLSTMSSEGFKLYYEAYGPSNPASQPTNGLEEATIHAGIYKSVNLFALWSDLAPTQTGGYDFSEIESGLATIDQYNLANPSTPITASLTVFAAVEAPDWVKQLDGGPAQITVSLPNNQTATPTLGIFWGPDYINAWRALQVALAARYDADPRIQQVQMSSCTSDTAEPFVLDSNLPAQLHPYGFSDAEYLSCLQGMEADYAPWQITPLYMPTAPFVHSDPGSQHGDPATALTIMNQFRNDLGSTRGIIGNNSLNTSLSALSANNQYIYTNGFSVDGPSMAFQLVSPSISVNDAVTFGLSTGMSDFEVWDSKASGNASGPTIASSDLTGWAAEFTCTSYPLAMCGATASGATGSNVVSQSTSSTAATTNQCPYGGTVPLTTTISQPILCINGETFNQGSTSTTTTTGSPVCNAAAACGSTPSGSTTTQTLSTTAGTTPATVNQCPYGGTQPTTTVVTQVYLCTNGTLTAQGSPTSTTTVTGSPTCNAAAACGSTASGSTTTQTLSTTAGTTPATVNQCPYGGTQPTTTVVTQVYLCTNGTLTAQGSPTSTTTVTGSPTCNSAGSCGSTPSGSTTTQTLSTISGSIPATLNQCPYGGTQPTTTVTTQTYLCTNGTLTAQGSPTVTTTDTGSPTCIAGASCGSTPSGASQTQTLSTISGSTSATINQCPYGGTQPITTVVTQTYLCTNGTLAAQGAPITTVTDTGSPTCNAPAACGATPNGSVETIIVSDETTTGPAQGVSCPYGGTAETTTIVTQEYLCTNGTLASHGNPIINTTIDSTNCAMLFPVAPGGDHSLSGHRFSASPPAHALTGFFQQFVPPAGPTLNSNGETFKAAPSIMSSPVPDAVRIFPLGPRPGLGGVAPTNAMIDYSWGPPPNENVDDDTVFDENGQPIVVHRFTPQ